MELRQELDSIANTRDDSPFEDRPYTEPRDLLNMEGFADKTASNRPLFSVIMASYNHSRYIDEAIQSVRNQSFQDWELIVVDDGSTDDSPAIIESHADQDGRIKSFSQTNAGPAAARNTAAAHTNGKWLTYLDSDDIWYPETLEIYHQAILEYPDCAFLYGYRDRLDEDGAITKLPGRFQKERTGTAELFGSMFLSPMRICHTKDLIDSVGGFDDGLRSCEDYELFLRMSLHTAFQPIGKSTGLRRRHGFNISKQTGFSRSQEAEVLGRFVAEQGGKDVLPEDLIRRRLARLYYASGRQYFKSLCISKAVTALKLSLKHRWTVKAAVLRAICPLLLAVNRDDGRAVPHLL